MLCFLKRCQQLIHQSRKLCLVLGNESCDLDSAVSALALAFFYSKTQPDSSCYVPILNTSRRSFPIKTEVVYFLKKFDITDELLLFKDDINNDLIQRSSIILVDHHNSPYRSSVIEVIDHRPFDKTSELPEKCKKTIQLVGSCATLIGDMILRSNFREFAKELEIPLQLLHGTIVMDTVNFSPQAARTTELDLKIASSIEDFLQISDRTSHRDGLFSELVKAREDTSSLTASQLLHKDMKLISNEKGNVKIGIPGYPMLVQDFIKLPNAEEAITTFASEHGCAVVFLIGMNVTNQSGVVRDIGVININNDNLCHEILEKIQINEEPNFQLREIENTHFAGGEFFQQENIKATRKHILPVLKNILDQKYQ